MDTHLVAFWNLENLFAPEGFPDREPWLAKTLAKDLDGWTQALFDAKVEQLTRIIGQMGNGAGPDILGVCEVENAFVLRELATRLNGMLGARQYEVVHADSTHDHRGIDTAFLYDASRYTVDPAAVFSHFVMRRTGTRDITQVTFRTQRQHELVAYCNHWPSRSGGAPSQSRGYRMTAGETLAYWHERVRDIKGKETPIIAVGDFNDDPFDESLTRYALATRERGDVERAQIARFYDLAWRYLNQMVVDDRGDPKLLQGTLYFEGNGNTFDQILTAKGLLIDKSPLRIREESARIEAYREMVDHSVAQGPIRFGLPKGDAARNVNTSGFSDHFPVSVVLEED